MDINRLNIEATKFLRELCLYSEQNTLQIDGQTAEVLVEVIQSIDQLIAAPEILSQNGNSTNFPPNVSVN